MDRPAPRSVRRARRSRQGDDPAGTMDNEWFCNGSDDDCLRYGGGRFVMGAAIGAGVGALVGWITSLGRD